MKDLIEKSWIIVVAVLAPIQSVIISVGVLVFADAITGIWASIKNGQGFNSAALRRTVSKLLIFQLCIITGFLVEQYLIGSIIPITKIIGGLIGLVELTSILENANKITGTNLFKLLIERLGSQNDIKQITDQTKKD